MRAVPFLILWAGCVELPIGPGADPGDDWVPVSYVDEGDLCFEDQGGDVVVRVTAPDCLSSSCSRDLGGSCEGTVVGDVVTLTSEVHWEQNQGPEVACTDDCGAPAVSCALPALADGTYSVALGTETVELVVPVTTSCGI